jgi:hypothetical protein
MALFIYYDSKGYIEVMYMSSLALGIMPMDVGTRWVYRMEALLFSLDAKLEVADKVNSYYLVKAASGNLEGAVILKADVDLSLVAYSNTAVETLENQNAFKQLPKVELLKSPIVTGTVWENNLGRFHIIDSKCNFKLGNKVYNDCIHLHLKDSSNADNHFYLKEGIGLIYAQVYIDNMGDVNIRLKKFN